MLPDYWQKGMTVRWAHTFTDHRRLGVHGIAGLNAGGTSIVNKSAPSRVNAATMAINLERAKIARSLAALVMMGCKPKVFDEANHSFKLSDNPRALGTMTDLNAAVASIRSQRKIRKGGADIPLAERMRLKALDAWSQNTSAVKNEAKLGRRTYKARSPADFTSNMPLDILLIGPRAFVRRYVEEHGETGVKIVGNGIAKLTIPLDYGACYRKLNLFRLTIPVFPVAMRDIIILGGIRMIQAVMIGRFEPGAGRWKVSGNMTDRLHKHDRIGMAVGWYATSTKLAETIWAFHWTAERARKECEERIIQNAANF